MKYKAFSIVFKGLSFGEKRKSTDKSFNSISTIIIKNCVMEKSNFL